MKWCINCGVELMDACKACNNCGAVQKPKDEKFHVIWIILGFIFPVVGLLLHMIWKNSFPKFSKSAGVGALAHVIALLSFFLIYALVALIIMLYTSLV